MNKHARACCSCMLFSPWDGLLQGTGAHAGVPACRLLISPGPAAPQPYLAQPILPLAAPHEKRDGRCLGPQPLGQRVGIDVEDLQAATSGQQQTSESGKQGVCCQRLKRRRHRRRQRLAPSPCAP